MANDSKTTETPAAQDNLETLPVASAEIDLSTSNTKPQESAQGKKPFDKKFFLRLTVTLFIITLSVALLLSVVNSLTKDKIADLKEEKRLQAMEDVLPGYSQDGDSVDVDGATVTRMTKDGNIAYCVNVSPKGFGGQIAMSIGVGETSDGEFEVIKASVISHAETMGDPGADSFISQYSGLVYGITLGNGENSIQAMTGATVSSKAVTLGVNTALNAVKTAVAANMFDGR